VTANKLDKELLQRMRFRNHLFRAPEPRFAGGVPSLA
jgi:hypothetical protein